MLTSKHVHAPSRSLVSASPPESNACVTDSTASVSRLLDKPETNRLDAVKESAFCVQSLMTNKLALSSYNTPTINYTD